MKELSHPHDRLFKALVSHPETAGVLLREYLPKEIIVLLTPDDPEPVPGSFVSQELQPYYSDMLFRSKTLSGRNLFFYTLVEHKSYPDRKVGWQLFLGCNRFMEQYEQENPKWTLMPAIISALMEAPELLIQIMTYIFTTFQHLDQNVVQGILVQVCPQEATKMMSIFAREIIEQHKHTWLQEGEQRGKAELLLDQLQERFGLIPETIHKQVISATLEDINAWARKIFKADSLQKVFQ
ncbi:MAG: Rpn family recombination-promoting nuclease/putative transposase [Magnetococcales bacterium]|nr:Rpn family recombination-promoting nuclease/putative transposase [Magnetococcales bacterium]MBF0437614.1 Rpn family recombination-promoting nuclease/putative transposase [Magnetococcales bacterium]